ncbi:hypothetical protein [uncultured Abiotrophia sp.]|uniref:hypothetical protein n=1 Tax=uncultured Abiotrophia sp. TaxID=316094 RepID=UPI0028D0AE49|nr:hypothetical protein [uncultured Abiotrophia sp.]
MTTSDIKPVLTEIGFYTDINTTPKNQITTPVHIKKLKRLLLKLSLTGLEHTLPGDEKPELKPFYLNICIFFQEGGKGGVVYSNYSVPITGYNTQDEKKSFDLLVDLFEDEQFKSAQLKEDLTYVFFNCSIFYSESELTTIEEVMAYQNTPYYLLYNSKLPLIGGDSDE